MKNLEQPMPAPPKHSHQFIIPVEWVIKSGEIYYDSSRNTPDRYTVTKLRCICGQEMDR